MPLYEFRCVKCGDFEVYEQTPVGGESVPCIVCGQIATRVWLPAGIQRFRSYWTNSFPDKSGNPVYVDSREQQKKLCEKHGFERIS
ncbi:MAG: hypothetical protein ACXABY_34480 [Candidatus Thorarchaeota archaeon]|jgi:putative FmdB family regulatory protein